MTLPRLTNIKTIVTLRGKDVGAHEATWSASITNDLPGRFTSGDAVEQRTGTINWAIKGLINDGISPMDKDYPHPGDRVTVDAVVASDNGTKTRRVFTGVIDVTTGGMGKPVVSTIIDDSDQLNNAVSWYPLVYNLPRRQNTVWPERLPGTGAAYILAESAEQCGFGVNYPDYKGRWFLHAHMVGSLWTDFLAGEGALIVSGWGGGEPIFGQILPDNSKYSRVGLGAGIACWDVNDLDVASNGAWIELETASFSGDSYFYAGFRLNSNTTVQLGVTNGVLYVYTNVGQPVRVADYSGSHVIGMFYPAKVGDSVWARIDDTYYDTGLKRTDADNSLIATDGSKSTGPETAPIFMYKSGRGITFDLVMGRMVAGSTLDTWKRMTASRQRARVNYELPGMITGYVPSADDQNGKSAIASVTEPFCLPSWIDGDGILNFVSGQALRERRISWTLAEGDYEPLEWDASYVHAASTIKVKGQTYEATKTGSGDPVITAWQGSTSDTFDSQYSMTDFFNVPDNVDYFEVDTVPKNLNQKFDDLKGLVGTSLQNARQEKWWWGSYSVYSVARMSEKSPEDYQATDVHIPGKYLFCNVERISKRTYKITYGYSGTWVKDSKPSMSPWIAGTLQTGMETAGTPILRAGARVTRHDDTTLSATTGGPPGPELVHDMGVYRGHYGGETMLGILKDYFSTVHPVFKDVTTVFNPGIDVGQMVTIDATRMWGYQFDCLVTHVEQDPAKGTTTFTPRVITSRPFAPTYEQLESKYRTYADIESSVSNYSELENR